MPKLLAPLLSGLASGLIARGLQLSVKPTGCFLTLPHRPTLTRTRKQKSIRTFTQALTQAWHYWGPSVKRFWAEHPRAKKTSPYHAFLWQNHAHLKANRWPVLAWNQAPVGGVPSIVSYGTAGRAQAISCRINTCTGAPMWIMAITHTPLLSAGVTPNKTNAWAWLPTPPNRWRQVVHLPAGTYTVWFLGVDAYSRPSNVKTAGGIVVTA